MPGDRTDLLSSGGALFRRIVDSLLIQHEDGVSFCVVWTVHHPGYPVLPSFPEVDPVRARMSDHVATRRPRRVTEERVWRRLDLIRHHDGNVVDLCRPEEMVHEAVEPLLSLRQCCPAQEFCPVVGDRAVHYDELRFVLLQNMPHVLHYQLLVGAVVRARDDNALEYLLRIH